MQVVTEFPHEVREIETLWIPLADGVRLAAKLWLPEGAEQNPAPAIIEYLPYRRRDGTAARDAVNHAYFAGHGYATLRIDIRGSGDSDGLFDDEYSPQEQADCVEAIAWIAAQPWCSGKVGMWGISWGGFNALQVAAHRPPALKAIITVCSTDDRYGDDTHYMGGCLLLGNLNWGANMFAIASKPPDPDVVGADWRRIWLERLEKIPHLVGIWTERQRRDGYWRQGSVCEDFSAIDCAVFAVGGWADSYTNAIPRLLAGLQCPRLGLIGPWGHAYAHRARPGPAIGFLQEALRWWDFWLKGAPTGIMEEPLLRAWMQEAMPPASYYEEMPGRWVGEGAWPSPRIEIQTWRVSGCGSLGVAPPSAAEGAGNLPLEGSSKSASGGEPISGGGGEEHADHPLPISAGRSASGEFRPPLKGEVKPEPGVGPDHPPFRIASPQTLGIASGAWCPYGQPGDLPVDQRIDDGMAVVFDSAPLAERLEFLGAPVLHAEISADKPNAFLVARLSLLAPDGAATRVSYGVLNLTHRDSHAEPAPLVPGKRYRIKLQLNDIGQAVPAGWRIRLALSNAYWPTIWPSPEMAVVTLYPERSRLDLPLRPPDAGDREIRAFGPPEGAAPLPTQTTRPPNRERTALLDLTGTRATVVAMKDRGAERLLHNGIEVDNEGVETYAISADDPLSARAEMRWVNRLARGGWRVRTESTTVQTATRGEFLITTTLDAYEGEERLFSRSWTLRIPRDHV
jgi:predicted acyl esterase